MQLTTADHKYSNALEAILNPTEITNPPNDKVLIRTKSLLYPENAETGILQPSDLLHDEGDITFSSFMREELDKVIKADQCAQYVDDIGIAANDADHLIANLRATFKCIQEAGLKLTMHKCHIGATEIDFLGRTILSRGVKPQRQNVQNFLEKTKFPIQKKFCKDRWAS